MNIFDIFNKNNNSKIDFVKDKEYIYYVSFTYSIVIIMFQVYITTTLRKFFLTKKLNKLN